MISNLVEGQDSDELEALFDSVAAANQGAGKLEPQLHAFGNQFPGYGKMIGKIGHLTRTLHDTMREMEHDRNQERAAPAIPETGDRLSYVATVLEQATERVLNAAAAAQPVVEKIEIESRRLAREWQRLFDRKLDAEQLKGLVIQTRAFLADVPTQTKEANAYLMEIMMAQESQDLTGQAIKEVIAVMRQTEKQLLELLIENSPSAANPGAYAGMLNDTIVGGAGRTDAVAGRDQVDELLVSLGF